MSAANAAPASAFALLRIEFRRSVGLLCFPLLVVAAGWLAKDSMAAVVYTWLDTSSAIRETVPFVGAFVAGISAWTAGRNKRRGMADLLSSTPRTPAARDLTTWAGTALWGAAVYVALAAVLLSVTWWNATWGAPHLSRSRSSVRIYAGATKRGLQMGIMDVVGPVIVALVYISLCSLFGEPNRRTFNAIFVAGAGAAYLSGGFGAWEFVFLAAVTYCAYRGLGSYNFIGAGWLLHTGWDVLHHPYGNPIVPFVLDSSLGCAICDPVIALWCFASAPSVYDLLRGKGRGGRVGGALPTREDARP